MKNQRMIFGAGFAVLAGITVFIGVIAVVSYAIFVPRVSIDRVRHDIEAGIPVGSSNADATRWLKSQPRIRYKGHIVDARTGHVHGIGAFIPDSGPLLSTPETIEIRVDLEDDKVSHVEVTRHETSL